MQTLLKLKIEHLEEGQEANYSAKVLLPALTPVPLKKGDNGKDIEIPQRLPTLTKWCLTKNKQLR